MNIHEYQAKQLLSQRGVSVPPGGVCATAEKAKAMAAKLFAQGYKRVIVKSQIHAGGRGKGTFKNGGQGGVRFCENSAEVYANAKAMLGKVLVTRQTDSAGRKVHKVLVEAALTVNREIFLAVILDRATSLPMIMVSSAGGMDIEEVAAKHPEQIFREPIDPAVGMMPYQARKIAIALNLPNELIPEATTLLLGVYQTWWECEATLVEINPLHVVEHINGDKDLVAVDGKITLDDNALYRHPELQELRDLAEESLLEIEASNYNLSYIKLEGNIACMVNGAGLAMATMDIIKFYGGLPANFLDVGGGAKSQQVSAAFNIILNDSNVRAILINIFGGIMQCDIIALGLVTAMKEAQLSLPVVVRLEGTNADIARQIIADSGLPVITATTLADAAEKAVHAADQHVVTPA